MSRRERGPEGLERVAVDVDTVTVDGDDTVGSINHFGSLYSKGVVVVLRQWDHFDLTTTYQRINVNVQYCKIGPKSRNIIEQKVVVPRIKYPWTGYRSTQRHNIMPLLGTMF
jgi:hypothetical protein